MDGYLSQGALKYLIRDAYPVFIRWHRGKKRKYKDTLCGRTFYYPVSDYHNWLNGTDPC